MIQEKQEDCYVVLARRTIEEYVRTGRQIQVPDDLPQEMCEQRAGVFVSINQIARLHWHDSGSAAFDCRGNYTQCNQCSSERSKICTDYAGRIRSAGDQCGCTWMHGTDPYDGTAGCKTIWRRCHKRISERIAAAKFGRGRYGRRSGNDCKTKGWYWLAGRSAARAV